MYLERKIKGLYGGNEALLGLINNIDNTQLLSGAVDGRTVKDTSMGAGKLSFTAFDTGTMTLDDVPDGATYERILKTVISAGKILLDETVTTGTYGLVLNTDLSAGHILLSESSGDLDDIANGTYGKVLTADISAGHVKLSATVESSTANYVTTNEKTGASDGYDFFETKLTAYGLSIRSSVSTTRVQIDATHIGGYASNVLQFGLAAADGKAYFGAGACTLDANGLTITGAAQLILFSDATKEAGIQFIGADDCLYLIGTYVATAASFISSLVPSGNRQLGSTGSRWQYIYGDYIRSTNYIEIGEISAPGATATKGKLYTRDDNKLYFQSGDGAEHEVTLTT